MGNGLFAARKLVANRKKFKWNSDSYKRKALKLWKLGPFEGAPQARGIVLEKRMVEQRKPSSGLTKAVRVQLVKNNIQVTAYVPFNKAIDIISEHDEVILEGIGGSQGGSIGSMVGIKFRVAKVNDVALSEIVKGKKQKPAR